MPWPGRSPDGLPPSVGTNQELTMTQAAVLTEMHAIERAVALLKRRIEAFLAEPETSTYFVE
jgi:hypothetical protein